MLNESGSGELVLPNYSLSIADIVGRSARLLRMNWKLAFRLFFFPLGLYTTFVELLTWLIQYSLFLQSGILTKTAAGLGGFLFLCLAIYLTRAAAVALWLIMSGVEVDISKAVKKARSLRTFLYFLPCVVLELLIWVTYTLFTISLNEIVEAGDPMSALAPLIFYLIFCLVWLFPLRGFELFNALIAYNAWISNSTFWAAFRKSFSDFLSKPFLVTYALFLICLVNGCLEITALLYSIAEGALKFILHIDSNVLGYIVILPRMALSILISIVMSWISTVSILFLDNELSIRLKGTDIINEVEKLAARES